MSNGAQRAYGRFNPEGAGFDEQIGDELIKLNPLKIEKPQQFTSGVVKSPGSFQAWVWHSDLSDYRLHGGSLDPRTGMILKGRNHPTWNLMEQEENRLGNTIIKKSDGRYYSIPIYPIVPDFIR